MPLVAVLMVSQSNPYQTLPLREVFGSVAMVLYGLLGAPDGPHRSDGGHAAVDHALCDLLRSSMTLRIETAEPDHSQEGRPRQRTAPPLDQPLHLRLRLVRDGPAPHGWLEDGRRLVIRLSPPRTSPQQPTRPSAMAIDRGKPGTAGAGANAMIWLYVLSAVALLLAPLAVRSHRWGMAPLIQELAKESGIPNLVSGVILHTRLFDTTAGAGVHAGLIGVRQMLGAEPVRQRIRTLTDIPSRVVCEQVATLAALVAVETALRGHLVRRGFAAGVAGGTAIGLVLISGGRQQRIGSTSRDRQPLEEAAVSVLWCWPSFPEGLTPGWAASVC